MKRKSILLLGLCIIGLCAWEAQASNLNHAFIVNMEEGVPAGYETIELHGALLLGTGPNAIVAGANHNSVYLHFNQSFGNVNVRIYNADGNLCYNGVVSTNVQHTVIIPMSGGNNGACTVVLDNANGEAEGEFEQD
jgi:hypothetical protein